MLGSAVWLTLATLLGLCLGFAREWLLVAAWGAGERSDAFLIALFLPEALRMSLAGGVLSAAALPLYLARKDHERLGWLAMLFPALLLIALVTSLLLTLLAPWLVQLLGPGLAASATALASSNLQIVEYGMNVATRAKSRRPQNGKRRMVTAPARPITARNALAGDNNRATAPNNRPKRMATRLGRVILTSVPRSIRPGVGDRRDG